MDFVASITSKIDLLQGTELEKKVRAVRLFLRVLRLPVLTRCDVQATSPETWNASSTLKNEIAQATFD